MKTLHPATVEPAVARAIAPRRSALAFLLDQAGLLAAATRAARAAEAHRDPHPADLRKLGIEGPLPKAW